MSKKKKCQYTDVISQPLDELLKLAPGNATIRTQVLNEIKISLPDEVQTYDAIVEWIEDNYDAKLGFDPDETVELEILLGVKRTGTCKRFVQYETTAGVKSKVRLLDIVRLFRKLNKDKRGWSRFRQECYDVLMEKAHQEEVAKPLDTIMGMLADAEREWDTGEAVAITDDPAEITYQTAEVHSVDIQNSNRVFDHIYSRLHQLYPQDVQNMEARD